MLSITRITSVIPRRSAFESEILYRGFAVTAEEQKKRIIEYNKQRKQYQREIAEYRKKYAKEVEEINQRFATLKKNRRDANNRKMQVISEKRKQQKESELRYHWEHLCNVQMEKSVHQVQSLISTFKRERIRNHNMELVLNRYMGYLGDVYRLEDVESRVLKEMKTIVPFDRVYLAAPYRYLDKDDVPAYESYDEVTSISSEKLRNQEIDAGLYKAWKEGRELDYVNEKSVTLEDEEEKMVMMSIMANLKEKSWKKGRSGMKKRRNAAEVESEPESEPEPAEAAPNPTITETADVSKDDKLDFLFDEKSN